MSNEKLEKLLAQRKALDAQIRLEQNRDNQRKRKEETRRKILAGAAVLDEASKHPKFKTEIYNLLGRFLKRNDERALFGLSPLEVVQVKSDTQDKPTEKGKTVSHKKAE
jgi:large subunit ribosomal protein L7/L12